MSLSTTDKTLAAIRALVPDSVFRLNAQNKIVKFYPVGMEPTPGEIAAKIVEQDAEREAERVQDEANEIDRQVVKGSSDIRALVRMRPAQIDTWIDTNINSMADVRVLLKRLTKVVSVLAKREFG